MSGRIVITGAGGQLGSCLAAQAARQGRDVLALTSSQWDITDPAAAERIVRNGDVVVNCAAYTNVDGAESDESTAYAVNAAGPEHIARACARAGARLIHVSTDYVFGGDFGGRRRGPTSPATTPTRWACTAAASSPANGPCWRRCRRPSWCGPPGSTPAGPARTSSPSCAGWPPGTARWTWSTTRPGRRPTWPTWPPRCCRSPTTACPGPSCTPPTRVRSPDSSRPARCSRNAVPTRSGCDRSAARKTRGPRPGRPTPRWAAGSPPRRGLTPLRPWRSALVAALALAPLPRRSTVTLYA